jgi:hypothetical protein
MPFDAFVSYSSQDNAHSRSRLQRKSDELDEIIAMFAETHAQTVELRRMLERTCRRAEAALALAREIRRLRL